MSLRADIRSAYDEITPPAPALQAQIRALVDSEANVAISSPRAHRPWMTGLRGTFALVAALLVVLIVASVLVGGRVWHDWNVFNNRPAPAGQIDPAQQLAQLEAIPLSLPMLSAGDACPDNPGVNSLGYDYGNGPVYFNGRLVPVIVSSWGYFYDLVYYSAPDLTGLVLVRGRDLRSERSILFADQYGGGAVVDTVGLEALHGELVLNVGHPRLRDATTGYGIWYVRLGVPKGWTGCWGMQIENLAFRETITGYSPPPPVP